VYYVPDSYWCDETMSVAALTGAHVTMFSWAAVKLGTHASWNSRRDAGGWRSVGADRPTDG